MQKYFMKCILILASFLTSNSQAEVVVVVAKAAGAVTVEQACAAFLGRNTQLVPINLAEGNALRDEFFRKYCDKDPFQAKAVWVKLIFTGRATSLPREVSSAQEMRKQLNADPFAVGYIEKSTVDASLKIISN